MRVISDFELSRMIASSRAFGAYPMADSYREMSARLGHDFAPAIALLDHLPTFMTGDGHGAMRNAMARFLGLVRQPQLAAAREFAAGFGAAHLRAGGRFDLMDDFARPLFAAMNQVAIAARQLPESALALIDDLPLLFSPFTPLKLRLDMNARLGALIAEHGEEIVCEIGVMVLGARPLTGGLARSVHAVAVAHPGARLADMPWPERLTISPVTYVDRICLEPAIVGDESFVAGEAVRCLLQVPDWSPEERQSTMFGVGSHLCLGRPVSELIWTDTVALFAGCALRASAGPLEMKPGSDPFELPAHCPIAIEG